MQARRRLYTFPVAKGRLSTLHQTSYPVLAAILSLSFAACGGQNSEFQNEYHEALKAAGAINATATVSPDSIKQGESFDFSVTVQSTRSVLVDILVGIKKPDGSSAYSAKSSGRLISVTSPIKIEDSVTVEQTDPTGAYSLFVTVVHCGTNKVLLDKQDAAQITIGDTSCVPNCAGKQCGSDGCDGSCGTCTASQICNGDNICESENTNTNTFDISVPLALDKTTVEIGETIQGTVAYKNNTSSAINFQNIVITSRPPNGTNADGPYMDFSPRASANAVQPGETIQLSASRTFASGDPAGQYRAYATYQDATGAWHDGPNVEFTVISTTCVPTTCEAQGKNCGSISDGCDGTLSCGSCTAPQTCSAANVCTSSDNSGHFETLPAGSTLPSDQECAARIRKSTWEPRPDNATANQRNFYAEGVRPHWDGQDSAQFYMDRVTGNFSGTTDEIIQWAACKWGIDEDVVRAQAVAESNWHQSWLGDCGDTTQPQTGGCASVGLLQVKGANIPATYRGTWPYAWESTAWNVDFALSERRACFDGRIDWLGNGYAAGDLWGCVGQWFSGGWHDSGAENYINSVKNHYQNRTWERAGF